MTHPTHPTRRTLMIGGATLALTLVAGADGARSESVETASVEGTVRIPVGGRELIGILDGNIALPAGLFSGATDEELGALLNGDAANGFINAFVVRGPDDTVLVDAGGGSLVGPSAGKLAERLGALGIGPGEIDLVLMTHLHPDHFGGLLTESALVREDAQLVLHERERAFWLDDENMRAAVRANGEQAQGFFMAARGVLERFGERVTPINGDGDVPGGMRSVGLFGHTPGHTGYALDEGDETLLIWGDIVHAPAVQFPRPDVTIAFDVDPQAARATRLRAFDMAATDKMAVAGMHLAFPAVGRVELRDGGGFAFVPVA